MVRIHGALAILLLLLAGCGGGAATDSQAGAVGGTPPPATVPPPPVIGISYPASQAWIEVGSAFGPWQPYVSGGVASQFSASPALPTGMTLNTATGELSGSHGVATPQAVYRISAQVAGTTAYADVALAVQTPPSGLRYAGPVQVAVGSALAPAVPVVGGDVDNYSISPALPDGLQFDRNSGVLSGTPTVSRVPATYWVTASNQGGASTSTDLVLSVGPALAGTPLTGVLRDPIVSGLGYQSGAQTGVTDQGGHFAYEAGSSVTFRVGGLVVGAIPVPTPQSTPLDLVANATGTSGPALNILRFLMMLDQDADPANGLQISPAVTAAAAGWGAVDFDAADLAAALGPIVQQAGTADGVTRVLPDPASAQALLSAVSMCRYSGNYVGIYSRDSIPGSHGNFALEVFPDGAMHAIANSGTGFAGFNLMTPDALHPPISTQFALSAQDPAVGIQGSFSDPTFLAGTYMAADSGSFEAASATGMTSIYKFTGRLTRTPDNPGIPATTRLVVLSMDDSGHVTGSGFDGYFSATVSGTTLAGSLRIPSYTRSPRFTVSGSFANTGNGYTLDGRYDTGVGGAVSTFATVGCRIN